jgi:ATP-binding cassette subfamily B protein
MRAESEDTLRRSTFLQFLPPEHYARVRALFREERYDFGDLIIRQGDQADAFFMLTLGRARVVKTTEKGEEISLKVLHPGDEFGEAALLSAGERTASVRCSTAVEVLRLNRDDFLQLVQECPEIKSYLELRTRWKTLHSFLYEYSNFGRLSAPALNALLEKLVPVEFAKGQLIIREGASAGPMYIIHEGRVRIYTQRNGQMRNLAFLREGDFFGELSMLNGSPRAASAEAVVPCRLLALPPEGVSELNRQYPDFAQLMRERLAQYQANDEATVPLDFATELLPAEVGMADQVVSAWEPPSVEEPTPTDEEKKTETATAEEPFLDEAGRFRKGKKRLWRVPFVRQIDEADCGAACLAMVCRHFGRKVSLSWIRKLCHTSYDGTSLKAMCHAAVELGLAARALKVSLRNLPYLPLPAIVHWEGKHWVVLYDVGKQHVRVADPGLGPRRLARAEFEAKWSGYAALFDYTERFEHAPQTQGALGWVVPFFLRHKRTLLQVLLLSLVGSVLLLLLPVFTQVIVDTVIVDQDPNLLGLVIGGMLATQGFFLLTNLLQQYLLSFVAVRIDSAMLDFLTRQLLSLPMSYFTSRRTGDIQRRLEGARQVRLFLLNEGIGALLAIVQLAGSVALMAVYHRLLLLVFCASLPWYAGLMYFSVRKLRPLYADLEETYGRYNSQQIDAIKGIEAVKAAAAEPSFREAMLTEFLTVARKRLRGYFYTLSYQTLLQLIGLLTMTAFLWVGARLVMETDGGLSIGAFMAFSTLLGLAGAAIQRALGMWDEWQLNRVLLDRLNDVFEQEPEQGRDHTHLLPVRTLEGHLELRHVSFRYGGPEALYILKSINLEIAPGRTVAIVGRSGCGKTTLVKLLAGLLEPAEGLIRFDRVDLKTLNYRELRRKVGIVLQENFMFSDTILRNIAFGDPEPNFDRALWAAQLANAHDFIMRLPLGYETRIGESGLALSGGQRQRIAIARAVYHDPPVLIFDEATSALDSESERAIQSNLSRLMSGRTSIVIAHRLSTIRDADLIVVLEKGQIVELGTHDELMAARGLYFYLSSQQLGI